MFSQGASTRQSQRLFPPLGQEQKDKSRLQSITGHGSPWPSGNGDWGHWGKFWFFNIFSGWGGGGICRLPAKLAKDHAGGVADSSRRLSASDTTGLRSQNSLHSEDCQKEAFMVRILPPRRGGFCCSAHPVVVLRLPPATIFEARLQSGPERCSGLTWNGCHLLLSPPQLHCFFEERKFFPTARMRLIGVWQLLLCSRRCRSGLQRLWISKQP